MNLPPPHRSRRHASPALLFAATCLLLATGQARAQSTGSCTVATSNAQLGTASTLALAGSGVQAAGSGGLSCASLALLSTSYVKVRLESSSFTLAHDGGGPPIPFAVLAQSTGPQVGLGQEFDFSSFDILNLFSGPGGSLPLFFRTSPTLGLHAGTYTGQVTLRWYFSICTLGIGVCLYSQSPGFQRPGVFTQLNWGTGIATTVNITLRLENDCAIAAPDLNFGSAPLAAAFDPVTQHIAIRCSAGTAYSVGLGNGGHFSGGWRRMRAGIADQYLRYELYKGAGSGERWGDSGAERRSSATAEVSPGIHDGTTAQHYTYRGVVDPGQATPPAGTYTDTIVVDVSF
ncbi:spore coat U domain-containing protein [Luteimonas sp. XNQY3]|nr:spore coat U domain-containing protein [Luteimonas sp. XNQY3]MCD9005489.1 spore coat U domain-containing protein [Luteimonas sp. XNQY3]